MKQDIPVFLYVTLWAVAGVSKERREIDCLATERHTPQTDSP